MHRAFGAIALVYVLLNLADRAWGDSPAAIIGSSGFQLTAADWPWWRGPLRSGVADSGTMPPVRWSPTENVLWKAEIPGRGHSSPTLVGGQIFLTTADEEAQYVLCFDAASGQRRWKQEVHRGGFPAKSHQKSSHASSTVACDGEHVFVNFMQRGAVFTTALTCARAALAD